MFKSLRLLALGAAAVTLSACYHPDGTIDPAGTALAGAAVGAVAGVAVGAAAARPHYYHRPYYGYGYRPRPYAYYPR